MFICVNVQDVFSRVSILICVWLYDYIVCNVLLVGQLISLYVCNVQVVRIVLLKCAFSWHCALGHMMFSPWLDRHGHRMCVCQGGHSIVRLRTRELTHERASLHICVSPVVERENPDMRDRDLIRPCVLTCRQLFHGRHDSEDATVPTCKGGSLDPRHHNRL